MKKFIAVLLTIVFVSGATIVSSAKDFYGDIDGNGAVNSSDALEVLKYVVGIASKIDSKVADVNHDGKVDSKDALKILQITVGQCDAEEIKKSTTIDPDVTSQAYVDTTYEEDITSAAEVYTTESYYNIFVHHNYDNCDYILNTSTMVFHKPTCGHAKKIYEENKLAANGTFENIVANGFKPCGVCLK